MNETASDKQPAKVDAKPAPLPPKPKRDEVTFPVASITLCSSFTGKLPGNAASNGLTAGKSGGNIWEIDFVPAIRAFRITYTPHGKEPQVKCIPESKVDLWEPAT